MAFTLAHFSDPHLPPLPRPRLKELAGKRVLGYLNWTRNRHKYYRREVLDALVRDLQAHTPDHVAVTCDLINLARAKAKATREVSSVIQRRPHCSATNAVVPEPQVGSRTRSPGSVTINRQRSTTFGRVCTM